MEQLGSQGTDSHEIPYVFSLKSKTACTLHKDLCEIMTLSRPVLLRMRNAWEKFRENQNTHFIYNKIFVRKSCSL
jgi:hypothetical protein